MVRDLVIQAGENEGYSVRQVAHAYQTSIVEVLESAVEGESFFSDLYRSDDGYLVAFHRRTKVIQSFLRGAEIWGGLLLQENNHYIEMRCHATQPMFEQVAYPFMDDFTESLGSLVRWVERSSRYTSEGYFQKGGLLTPDHLFPIYAPLQAALGPDSSQDNDS